MADGNAAPYLRHPHLHGDRICFVTEDDVWVAPLPDGGGENHRKKSARKRGKNVTDGADGANRTDGTEGTNGTNGAGDPGGGPTGTGGAPGGEAARAWRLTVDRTRVGWPRFSPDGRHIAYTSWRSHDPEVHLAPVDGGPSRRLTHWGSTQARVCGWTPEGDVLAVSSHDQPFRYHTWSYRLPLDGGPGSRLPWGPVADIAVAELDGVRRTLLLTGKPPHDPAAWKRYRGGATGRLWLHGERLLPDIGGHLDSVMFVGDRIAFLSDHEGVGNLYSCRPDGSGLRRHTDHDDFYARQAATDGSRVVYQCAGDLWLVDDFSPSGRPRRLDIALGGPRTGRRRYQVPAANHLDSFAADTTGRASAVCVRGSLYWLTHRDGPARAVADAPGVRVRLPLMLGDTGRVAYVTDAGGADAVELAYLPRATRTDPPRRLAEGRLGHVREMAASPDGRTLAVASNDGRLLLLRTDEEGTGAGGTGAAGTGARGTGGEGDGGEDGGRDGDGGGDADGLTELIRSDNGRVRHLAFSPDSRWLAWSHPGVGRTLSQIKIARLDEDPDEGEDESDGDGTASGTGNGNGNESGTGTGNGTASASGTGTAGRTQLDVTDGRFEDEQPVFTRDGRYLAFLSWRGFDPVYDVHTGDLSFPQGCRPHLVPLSSATPSPFALSPEGRPASGGLDAADDETPDDAPVTVEAEGLSSRVVPFPVAASKYSALAPVAGGGLIWLRYPISGALGDTFADPDDASGRPTLEHFDLAKSKRTELTASVDSFSLSGDGTRLVVNDEGDLRAVPAAEAADPSSTTHIDLRRVMHEADPAAEWRQAYEEAGRLVRAYFWDPDMCGVDWAAMLDQYRPLLDRVASPDEFADLLRELMGELGTSHAYVTPARRDEGPASYQRPIGLLGADIAHTPSGEWYVQRILPGESSDPKARSPLAGTGIREGAVLTHVDGRPVDPVAGPWPLLSAAGGTTVEIGFRQKTAGTDGNGDGPDEADGRDADEGKGKGKRKRRDAAEAEADGRDKDGSEEHRRIAVLPLIYDTDLRYQDWVARRRAVVRELSEGRCGYLHIPDMGGSGWAQFHRDLRTELSLPALIIDVRGNAGGHISELVVESLTRRILGWDLTRDAQPVSYSGNAPRGPIVALTDEMTCSDGDMITAAFRLLKLGPVIGARTWGGVVGITGRHRLVDGTTITVPMNAAWFDEYGWSVENHGVAPDVEAIRTPVEWAEGTPSVLDKAVRTALELLAENPAKTPPGYDNVPDLSRPPLPPR